MTGEYYISGGSLKLGLNVGGDTITTLPKDNSEPITGWQVSWTAGTPIPELESHLRFGHGDIPFIEPVTYDLGQSVNKAFQQLVPEEGGKW